MLIGNGTVVTMGEKDQVIEGGAVALEKETITEVGSFQTLKLKYPSKRFIDAGGGLILPGLINLHTHLYSTFARGKAFPGPPPRNFVQILNRVWWKLDRALNEEDVYYSAITALMEMARCGTTTLFDHHSSPACIPGSLDIIEQAVREVGLRACLCYEVSDRDGPQVKKAAIRENARFIDRCHSRDDMVRASFGLHASFTIKDQTLRQAVEAGGTASGFHIHLAEDRADEALTIRRYGVPLVRRLYDAGVLGPKSLAAHGVHLGLRSLGLIGRSGVTVVHNPQSNLNNAVGTAPIAKMLAKGIRVGLGSDGFTGNLLSEMVAMGTVHKLVSGNPSIVSPRDVVTVAMRNNAATADLFFPKGIGTLRAGAPADLVIFDYKAPTPLDFNSFPGHLLFGLPQARVVTTIVAGRPVVEGGRNVNLDENLIFSRAQALAKSLWERIQ